MAMAAAAGSTGQNGLRGKFSPQCPNKLAPRWSSLQTGWLILDLGCVIRPCTMGGGQPHPEVDGLAGEVGFNENVPERVDNA